MSPVRVLVASPAARTIHTHESIPKRLAKCKDLDARSHRRDIVHTRLYSDVASTGGQTSVTALPTPVPSLSSPSVTAFGDIVSAGAAPLLLRDAITHWPALSAWRDFANLKRPETAALVMPVEVSKMRPGDAAGKGYNAGMEGGAKEWECVDMPFDVFVDAFMAREASEGEGGDRWVGYLSQQPLLEQVPSLAAEVSPPLAYTKCGRGDQWPTNVWIGTAGTFTPIHRDPYHNLFCQIVGTKHIQIFPPFTAAWLYLSTGLLQRNTSRIPAPEPDIRRFPLYHEHALRESWEVTIRPGEVLFVPRGFFHSVVSLEKSVSVNNWFL